MGLRKTHTKTHTRQKNTLQRCTHIYTYVAYRALADGRIMRFPQADRLCQQPVLRRCVFSSAKSITGSHVLSHTDWILNQRHDLNLSERNLLSSIHKSNFKGLSFKFDHGRLLLRHFWATHDDTTHGVMQLHKSQRPISYSPLRAGQQGPAL